MPFPHPYSRHILTVKVVEIILRRSRAFILFSLLVESRPRWRSLKLFFIVHAFFVALWLEGETIGFIFFFPNLHHNPILCINFSEDSLASDSLHIFREGLAILVGNSISNLLAVYLLDLFLSDSPWLCTSSFFSIIFVRLHMWIDVG